MVIFSNCKINLGLHVTGKRPDGYHDIATVFYPLPLKDAIEIIPAQTTALHISGVSVPGDASSNLCYKAWNLLKKDHPQLPPVDIYLHKAIPVGAGLGGGSANGAFTLRLLNEQFQLQLSTAQLAAYALQLGSDCPFFILNEPCLAQGRGEILESINLNLSGYFIAVLHPGIHISTAWAFSAIQPTAAAIPDIAELPVRDWKNVLFNDFEAPVFSQYPEIARIKEQFYNSGALYAGMTGTGSTIFGIFDRQPAQAELGDKVTILPL